MCQSVSSSQRALRGRNKDWLSGIWIMCQSVSSSQRALRGRNKDWLSGIWICVSLSPLVKEH